MNGGRREWMYYTEEQLTFSNQSDVVTFQFNVCQHFVPFFYLNKCVTGVQKLHENWICKFNMQN